jgi:hypothetical protein
MRRPECVINPEGSAVALPAQRNRSARRDSEAGCSNDIACVVVRTAMRGAPSEAGRGPSHSIVRSLHQSRRGT